jgi:deoxyribonuclease V
VEYRRLHPWNLSPSQALALQNSLREQIRIEPLDVRKVRLIAGADISYNRFSDIAHAAFVVLDIKTLKTVATGIATGRLSFPYVPGLLTFREGEPLLEAWKNLRVAPDVVVFDGQGIAHPRGLGIAAHMGLLIDRPSLGCGKSVLCGHYENLDPQAGSTALLMYKGKEIGAAYRTKTDVQPVYISPGYKIDLKSSLELIAQCVSKYRIPEPTRQAHILANELRRAESAA